MGLSEGQRELIGSTCFSHKGPRSDYTWLVRVLHCADHLYAEQPVVAETPSAPSPPKWSVHRRRLEVWQSESERKGATARQRRDAASACMSAQERRRRAAKVQNGASPWSISCASAEQGLSHSRIQREGKERLFSTRPARHRHQTQLLYGTVETLLDAGNILLGRFAGAECKETPQTIPTPPPPIPPAAILSPKTQRARAASMDPKVRQVVLIPIATDVRSFAAV